MTDKKTFFPAEWAKQDFVQMTFPNSDTDWAYMLDEVNECFVHIAYEIAKRQKLLVVCKSATQTGNLLKNCNLSNVVFFECAINDTWARDHAAITVVENGIRTLLDFTFNGWGLKFPANHDNLITNQLVSKNIFGKNTLYKDCRNFVLEGGSIETDGEGTMLTTEKCLLSENRNYLKKKEIEDKLKLFFGVSRILWLKSGSLKGDDTDSHIDTLARLCPNDTIVYVKCGDKNSDHFFELQKMETELRNFRTLNAKPYNLVPLPLPAPIFDSNANRLPATYANYLIINGAVLVPVYNTQEDETACSRLQELFPDREIVAINCLPLIKQHGSLHCLTMQFPVCPT
ncbi:MAG: agmatine deiminase family protein [Prevotellaceae bacterium]|jgi:agmatine/peptidylarginine deiminase|nr:agmatine deiminase family protein [Prevotellaceae bacterium]